MSQQRVPKYLVEIWMRGVFFSAPIPFPDSPMMLSEKVFQQRMDWGHHPQQFLGAKVWHREQLGGRSSAWWDLTPGKSRRQGGSRTVIYSLYLCAASHDYVPNNTWKCKGEERRKRFTCLKSREIYFYSHLTTTKICLIFSGVGLVFPAQERCVDKLGRN